MFFINMYIYLMMINNQFSLYIPLVFVPKIGEFFPASVMSSLFSSLSERSERTQLHSK